MPSNQPTGPIQMPPKVWLGIVAAVVIVMLALYSGTGSKTTGPTQKAPQVSTASLETVDGYAKKLERQALEEQKRQAALALREASAPPGTQAQQPQGQQYQPQPAHTKRTHIFFSDRKEEPKSKELASLRSQIDDSKAQLAQMLRPAPEGTRTPIFRKGTPEEEEEYARSSKPKIDPELQQAKGKKYRLFEGTIIETVLENRLDGAFSGTVIAQVTTDVWSHDHERMLIPAGTRIIGKVDSVATTGQQRLRVSFHRILMPDGYSIVDQFHGLDQAGSTGLKGRINNHYLSIFGTSLALGLISGATLYGTGSAFTSDGADQYRQGVSNSLGRSANTILEQKINRLPTIQIIEGTRIKVMLDQDVLLPAYDAHRLDPDL